VPTSVLLAVLAAAALLALAPALVRRYDATERLVAERAMSTARVLARAGTRDHRRRRTVPGRRPLNPPRVLARQVASAAAFTAGAAVFTAGAAVVTAGAAVVTAGAAVVAAAQAFAPADGAETVRPADARGVSTSRGAASPRRSARARTAYRRRRTFLLLIVLNLGEAAGAAFLAPGFLIAVSVTGFLLVAYVVHLRNRALIARRRRRAAARYAAWVAARQAAVRREQARRAAERRELLERHLAARDLARRAASQRPRHGTRAASL
jgi:hypothetical protein